MTRAQTAWAILTGLFLVCSTIVITTTESATPFAVTGFVVAVVGWLVLIGMILGDRR